MGRPALHEPPAVTGPNRELQRENRVEEILFLEYEKYGQRPQGGTQGDILGKELRLL